MYLLYMWLHHCFIISWLTRLYCTSLSLITIIEDLATSSDYKLLLQLIDKWEKANSNNVSKLFKYQVLTNKSYLPTILILLLNLPLIGENIAKGISWRWMKQLDWREIKSTNLSKNFGNAMYITLKQKCCLFETRTVMINLAGEKVCFLGPHEAKPLNDVCWMHKNNPKNKSRSWYKEMRKKLQCL